jgi:hypothetical protein
MKMPGPQLTDGQPFADEVCSSKAKLVIRLAINIMVLPMQNK